MKDIMQFICKDYLALICIGIFNSTLSSSFGYPIVPSTIITAAIMTIYMVCEIAHEFGHYIILKRRGYQVQIRSIVKAEVISHDVQINDAKIAAVSGPLVGAFTGLVGTTTLVRTVNLPAYYYIFTLILIFSHLVMLLPMYPDGRILIIKQQGRSV